MQQSDPDKERGNALAGLRFAPELEAQFRRALRGRLRLTRSVMFAVIGLGFACGPLYHALLGNADARLLRALQPMEWGVALLLALTSVAIYLRARPRVVNTLQFSSALSVLAGSLVLRGFALLGGLRYPAEMTSVILIAIAFFGGFSWRRVATGAALFIGAAIVMEFALGPYGTAPLLQVYPLFFMAAIAILGSYVQERVTRLNWRDLTRLRDAQAALHESERRFEAFMDHTPAIAWIKDDQSRYQYRNKAHRDRYGAPGENWTGHTDAEHFPSNPVATYRDTDRTVLESGQPVEFETLNHSRDGQTNEWLVQKFRFTDAGGHHFVAGMGVDIGERNRLQQRLRESEALFQGFLDNSPTVSWMKDEEGRYLYVSGSYRQFLGVTDESWLERTDFDYFPVEMAQEGRRLDLQVLETGEVCEAQGPATGADGVSRHWLLVRFRFTDHKGRRFIGGVANDVTLRKQAEDIVRLQSLTDELSGLYNRRGFSLLVEQQLHQARRLKQRCALLYVDMDGLKGINERYGHDGGDQAITAVSEALRVAVRASDIVARIGGDEFVVFASGCDDVALLKRRVLDSVTQYGRSESLPFRLSVSIGVSEFEPAEGVSVEAMMAQADAELLSIKRVRTIRTA